LGKTVDKGRELIKDKRRSWPRRSRPGALPCSGSVSGCLARRRR